MSFRSVRVYNYRNLKSSKIHLGAKTVYLVGENGQGKTNFLEALYILCYGSSFRTRDDKLLVSHGEEEMSILGVLEREGEVTRINCKYTGKKRIEVNGKPIRDRKELLKNSPCILFCHEDIDFVKGAPEGKRTFLNQTVGLYDPLFIDDLRTYSRVLKMRNNVLKTSGEDILEVLDHQLIEAGRVVMQKRRRLIDEFQEPFARLFHEISGLEGEISLLYRPSWPLDASSDDIREVLRQKRLRDRQYGLTHTGPHRDGLQFRRQNREFTKEASTGQLRLMSLILRVAQATFYSSKTGRKPLLLLDDVLLELDPKRRRRFIEALPDYEQALFTFLPEENLLQISSSRALIYRVDNGMIAAYEESP